MEGIEIDVTAIVAVWMGGAVLMVALLGVAARFGIRPALEALARVREAGAGPSAAELAEHLERLEREIARLADAMEQAIENGELRMEG